MFVGNLPWTLYSSRWWYSGLNLVRADRKLNSKRGGAYIYFKNYLPLKIFNIQYLQECINFELMVGKCIFISLYRSRSQTKDSFHSFRENLGLNLDSVASKNRFLIVLLGDFNAQSEKCYLVVKKIVKVHNWWYCTTVWIRTIHQWTNSFPQRILFMYRFNLYISTKFSSGTESPLLVIN